METCSECEMKDTMKCVSSALLCEIHVSTHMSSWDYYSVTIIKPSVVSEDQQTASKKIFNQLKVLDECYAEITCISKNLIKVITKLSENSLKTLQENRVTLLDNLKIASKNISAQELIQLQAISQESSVKQTECLNNFKDRLRQYFRSTSFKPNENIENFPTLRFSNATQAKQLLINSYGLFLEGHTSHILCVAITSDNKYLVSGSWDKTVRILNFQDKRQEAILQGHTGYVWSVAITSDNKYIVSGSADQTVRVWNFRGKYQEAVLKGHISLVLSVVITNDNKFVVSSSEDKTVRVWNLLEKRQEAVLQGHTSLVKSVAITSDNKFIVSGSWLQLVQYCHVYPVQAEHMLE